MIAGAYRLLTNLPRPGFWLACWWPPVACAGLVLLGSLEHGTTRVFPPSGGGVWTSEREGWERWAGWTFLFGLAVLALLVAGAFLEHYWGPTLAALAAGPFAAATSLGRKNWLQLIEERDHPRDYELFIPVGLPVVTVAATAGTVLTLVLAVAWQWQVRRGALV
jgi:hypothetical protein